MDLEQNNQENAQPPNQNIQQNLLQNIPVQNQQNIPAQDQEKKNEEIIAKINDIVMDKNDDIKDLLGKASKYAENIDYSKREKKISAKKQQKPKGKIASFIDGLIEGGKRDFTSIFNTLRDQNKDATKEEAEFYVNIIKYTILNTKYSISDILGGKSFQYFLCNNGFSDYYSFVFSNDKLFWLSRMYNVIENDKTYFDLLKCLNFKNQTINLQSLGVLQKDRYESGYFRDYNYQFSCIFTNNITKDDLKKAVSAGGGNGIIKGINYVNKKFTFENIEYIYAIFDSGETIVVSVKESGNLDKLCNEMNIYTSRKDMKEGELKIIPIKKSSASYLSQDVKLTDFCPQVISFGELIPYSFSFVMDFNMDLLENYFYDNFYQQYQNDIDTDKVIDVDIEKYITIKNLVTWDTLDVFCNFLIIETATKLKKNAFLTLRSKINKFVDAYKKEKKSFVNARNIINKILNFFTRFFFSFRNRINTDLIEKFKDDFYKSIKNKFEECKKQGDFLNVSSVLLLHNLNKICLTVHNCVKKNAEKISDLISLFENFLDCYVQKKGDKILSSLKDLGIAIMSIFKITNKEDQLINRIVTPSAFLGNFLGGSEGSSIILVDKINRDVKNEINENIDAIDFIKEAMNYTDEDALKFALESYLESTTNAKAIDDKGVENPAMLETIKNFKFNEETVSNLIAIGRNALAKNEDLDYKIISAALDDEENKELKDFLKTFMNNVEKDKTLKKLNIVAVEDEILKLRHNLNNGNMDLLKPIAGVATEESMKALGIKLIDTDILDPDVANEVFYLRGEGITDDVIRKNFKDHNEIPITEAISYNPTEEEIEEMKNESIGKWGMNGTKYKKALQKLEGNVVKKMKLKSDAASAISRKSMSFKSSLSTRRKKALKIKDEKQSNKKAKSDLKQKKRKMGGKGGKSGTLNKQPIFKVEEKKEIVEDQKEIDIDSD